MLAVVATYGLLLVGVARPLDRPGQRPRGRRALVTVLVVVRQVLAVRENVRLLAETAARQSEARFRSLVQHSSDVIIVIDADGTIRFVSPSASRVFGYEPAALVEPRACSTCSHPDDRDRAAPSSATRGQRRPA